MNGFLQKIKTQIRYYRKRIPFHNKVISSMIARIRYWFPNADIRESLSQMFKAVNGDSCELDWNRDKGFILKWLFYREFYTLNYIEDFRFCLREPEENDRLNYVGWRELEHYYLLLNAMGSREIFDEKDRTYQVFKPFFKREMERISSVQDKERFLSFLRRHDAGIIKPVNDYGGHGVEIIRCADEQGLEEIWERVSSRCPFLLEELIVQAPEMNAFYPGSVNTIRYNTFFHEGKLTKMQAIFRMGRGGSVVDNATSGGIYTLLDPETGRILSPARSDFGEFFETHPDTGIRFEGNQIPRWEELMALVDQVVRVVPQQKQVGWDFALSTDGWVIVEGNSTPSLQGLDSEHCQRPLLRKTYGTVIPLWE